ncbi:MAG: hypothetical protein AAB453_04125 [Patescibacteria group bacterium]
MEKFQEWRDEKAAELKNIEDHQERRQKLEEIRSEDRYSFSEWQKLFKRWHLNLDEKNGLYYDPGSEFFEKHSKDLNAEFILEHLTAVDDLIPGINKEKLPSLDSNDVTTDDRIVKKFTSPDDGFFYRVHDFIIRLDIEKIEQLRESFKDKVVVEIGTYHSGGYELACLLSARAYIAVEPNYYNRLIHSFLQLNEEKITERVHEVESLKDLDVKSIPFNFVSEDGLTFLRRLPDNSVIPLDIGISDLLARYGGHLKDYYPDMQKKLGRVIKSDSYYIKCNSVQLSLPPDKKFVDANIDSRNYVSIDKVIATGKDSP